jgi:hypothetical protein
LRRQAASLSPLHATAFPQPLSYFIKNSKNCLREFYHHILRALQREVVKQRP